MDVRIELLASVRINLALLQNRVPIIRSIRIYNDGDSELQNLHLRIKSDPEQAVQGDIRISLIRPQESFISENPKLSHSWTFFKSINEGINGRITIEICDSNGSLIKELHHEVTFEPENVWLGQSVPIELLASHIMPNSISVQKILRRSSDILKEKTSSSALNGYQSKDKRRVYEIAQSIYLAIREENISYAEPPASFEESGQKVRTPEQVINQGMGTCLDLSLLYAACLEQSGLHSIIFIIRGHAFAGFWLEDKFLPRPTDEDPQFFRKRIDLDEIVALEITGVANDGPTNFQSLEESAKKHFLNESDFVTGVDISHCRRNIRIYPLSELDLSQSNTAYIERDERNNNSETIEAREFQDFELPENIKARASELDKWKDKLLDLSFRNRLLNFKANRGTVQVLCHSPAEMEDVLADGSEFEILPEPEQSGLNLSRTDLNEILSDQITASFQLKRLLTTIKKEKFSGALTNLYRSAVSTEEETGANTLFLALGVLSWKEADSSEVIRKSPILMLPVNLKRKSVGNRFFLELRDDDTIINNTLLQKLKRDFGIQFPGLDELPLDESGVDVNKVFRIFETVIKDKRGWEVEREVWLSEFSFQKYLMWKELDSHFEEMLESPIIRRIMTSEVQENEPDFISEDQVETLLHPKDIFCPLSADSSQMAAVLSAANGNSFVLQGPPGTGKSQTIANMMAHCIAIGKRVLFVSEKKVALEVVYRRLNEIGVGQFCLELHSKKSEKKEVVKSFMNSLEFTSSEQDRNWNQVAEELKTSRDGLNSYFHDLHEHSSSGISAYKAYGVSQRKVEINRVDLDFVSFLDLPADNLILLEQDLKKWKQFSASLSEDDYPAWANVRQNHWSIKSEDSAGLLLDRILNQLHEISSEINSESVKISLVKGWSFNDWIKLGDFAYSLLTIPSISASFLKQLDFENYVADFKRKVDHLKRHLELKEGLEREFKPSGLALDFEALKFKLHESKGSFFIIKLFKQLNLKSELKKVVKGSPKPLAGYDQIFEAGIKYQNGLEETKRAFKFIEDCFGKEYSLENDKEMRESMIWAEQTHQYIKSLYSSDFELISLIKIFISSIIENKSLALAEGSELRKELLKVHQLLKSLKENFDSLVLELDLKENCSNMSLTSLSLVLQTLQTSFSQFKDVTAMNSLKHSLIEKGLDSLFELIDTGKEQKGAIEEIFRYNFYRQWLEEKTDTSEILNSITGLQLNNLDASFKIADTKYRSLAEKALCHKIAQRKPKIGNFVVPDSPVGTIIKESKKSRKLMPIRTFLDSISSVSKSLKPCYMMSPISVSQYLPVAPDFDIVIFDEASQIPPWDAIGALARGKQAIIVGDTKQLPPTAFFSQGGDDDSDEKIDCESVLEMFGTLFPEMLLKWHYRSRSESLISFSNYHIYDNRLHTFPSSEADDNKVSLKVVTGKNSYYDRGKTKTNQGEAEAVVREIFTRLKNDDEIKSIGVVTFSSAQSTLINDLIDTQLQLEPKFESYFNVSNPDYIFIKSLENVQGDERDLILFSIGYGKDFHGKINKNFGPLNNSGGERRLNVAVTRAKCEVRIFSNFHPREFDTTSSTSEGLRLLKEYMLYAEEGHTALFKQQTVSEVDNFDSLFEEQVANKLRERGWEVRTQVGIGGYRIDLGVVHPNFPGKFLAGIECDGARYHSAKSARDRDILRQGVLEGLGWNILRIWSTDWWYDNNRCLEKLEEQLNALLVILEEKELIESLEEPEEENSPEVSVTTDNEDHTKELDFDYYDASLLNIVSRGDFFEEGLLVQRQIKDVVESLAPISKEECFSLISRAWGFARKGNRIEEYLNNCERVAHKTKSNGRVFFWNSSEEPKALIGLRVPVQGDQRHPSSVAPEELVHGLLLVLRDNISVQKSDLFKQVAKMLGYSRITQENMDNIEPALKLLVDSSQIEIHDGIVTYIATN